MYVPNLHIPQENDVQKNGKDVRDYVRYYNCDKYYHKKTVYSSKQSKLDINMSVKELNMFFREPPKQCCRLYIF